MSDRRMFSKRITNSGRFLKMPTSSQALYFHLGMEADDDGVVEAFKVIRSTGFGEDDLRVLVAKGFIKVLNEDLVSFILDWREHNLIRADRKIDSIYKDLLLQIVPEANILNPIPRADTMKLTGGRPVDVQWTSQDRLGKDNIPYSPPKGGNSSNELNTYLEEFNLLFNSHYQLTNGRVKKLDLRLKMYTLDQILTALRNLARSDFHKGKNERGWVADPDFLLRNDEQIDKWLNYKSENKPRGDIPYSEIEHLVKTHKI